MTGSGMRDDAEPLAGPGAARGSVVARLRRQLPLPLAAVLVATAILAGFDVLVWLQGLTSHPTGNDFADHYTAARLGLAHGWAAVWDWRRFTTAMVDFTGVPGSYRGIYVYAYPMWIAWSMTPIALLPYPLAVGIASVLVVGSLVLAWALLAGGRWPARLAQLTAAVGLFPVAFGLILVQLTFVALAGLALSVALLRRRRDLLAGAALALCLAKPQTVVLVPVALLATGRWRSVVSFGTIAVALAAATFLTVGGGGVRAYLDSMSLLIGYEFVRRHALLTYVPQLAAPAVVGAIVAAVAASAYRQRRSGPETPIVLGVLGSLLVTPYLNEQDLSMLLAPAWLLVPSIRGWRGYGVLLVTYLCLEFVNVVGPLPILIVSLAWLGYFAVVGVPRIVGQNHALRPSPAVRSAAPLSY